MSPGNTFPDVGQEKWQAERDQKQDDGRSTGQGLESCPATRLACGRHQGQKEENSQKQPVKPVAKRGQQHEEGAPQHPFSPPQF